MRPRFADSGRVSRRMRQALAEFRDRQAVVGEPEHIVGDGETEQEDDALEQRMAALEEDIGSCGNWWRAKGASWRSWHGG